jgi:hypothetical protein
MSIHLESSGTVPYSTVKSPNAVRGLYVVIGNTEISLALLSLFVKIGDFFKNEVSII